MSSWHCFVEERAEQMRMLRRGAAALVLIALRRAFLAWGQHALATSRTETHDVARLDKHSFGFHRLQCQYALSAFS